MDFNEEKEKFNSEKKKINGENKKLFDIFKNKNYEKIEVENTQNEALLHNYVSQIKHVKEKVFLWKLCDEIDIEKSEEMYNGHDIEDAFKSMKMSLFSDQLKNEKRGLKRVVSKEGICGAVMLEHGYLKDNLIQPCNKDLVCSEVNNNDSDYSNKRYSPSNIQCIKCERRMEEGRWFLNMCSACSTDALRIMSNVKEEEDLVCVGDPPCWSCEDNVSKCEACVIQGLVLMGLKFGPQYQVYNECNLQKLKSQESILRARKSVVEECQRQLSSCAISPFSACCILPDNVSCEVSCHWDMKVFSKTIVEDQVCYVCHKRSYESSIFYIILPSKKHFICHQCVLRVYQAQLKLTQPCSCSNSEVSSCEFCLLKFCRTLFPLTAVQRRFRTDTASINCKLCGEQDSSRLETLRCNSRLCLVCLLRIKVHVLSSSPSCTRSCPLDKCASCLSQLASCVIHTQEIVTFKSALKLQSNVTATKLSTPKDESPDKPKRADTANKKVFRNDLDPTHGISPSYIREKRQIKPTQFQDFVVDKSITEVLARKSSLLTNTYEVQSARSWRNKCSNDDDYDANLDLDDLDRDSELEDVESNKDVLLNNVRYYPNLRNNIRQRTNQGITSKKKSVEDGDKGAHESCVEEVNLPRQRRIKHAVQTISITSNHVIRPGGPRVKQVSRVGLTSLDSETKTREGDKYKFDESTDEEEVEDPLDVTEMGVVHDNNTCGVSNYDQDHEAKEWTQGSDLDTIKHEEGTKSQQDLLPQHEVRNIIDLDVYRNSNGYDSEDADSSNINTVKNETITASLANEGGYPIVTSHNAMPNKVLCYSCGSGGDHMINCISCAEPFHFFCIDFQFRPKVKDVFVCRNCTKCNICKKYSSDLKCINCQSGYHPSCVGKYPPTHSEDRSNWVCHKCAMCLQCGIKAEDVMEQSNGDIKQIYWDKSPWQCGVCCASRKKGHVCPECNRAYQREQMTIKCHNCSKSVHIQCVGLTEDEFEMYKTIDDKTYKCSKCKITVSDDVNIRRFSLKRQCKDTNLKIYCDKLVKRRVSSYIHKAETKEEQILKGIEVIGPLMFSQVDGNEDGEDVVSSNNHNLKSVVFSNFNDSCDKDVNSTLCDSSESIDEYDVDRNTVSCSYVHDFQHFDNSVKVGIFCTLKAADYLSPRHMIMDSLAKITVMLYQLYPLVYNDFVEFLYKLCNAIFPWINFQWCLTTVHDIIRKNSGRIILVLKTITGIMKDNLLKEISVFSSSLDKIERKIAHNFSKDREDFIDFYSRQHISALIESPDHPVSESSDMCYENILPFSDSDNDDIVYEKDVRQCILCNRSGDNGLEGRLIYGSQDVWIHVNCALWSDEVFEKDDGALVNVDQAIIRGRQTICASCSNYGATVKCSAVASIDGLSEGCDNCYHFYCAFKCLDNPIFTEKRTFYCTNQHDGLETKKSLSITDMPILRRIYIPMNGFSSAVTSKSKFTPCEDIVITIGSLRVDCLGTLMHYSDSFKPYLCPVNYKARRLFWSTTEVNSLVMYAMSIKDTPAIISSDIPCKIQKTMETIDSQRTGNTVSYNTVYGIKEIDNYIKCENIITPSRSSEINRIKVFPEIQKINRRFPDLNKVLISNSLGFIPKNNLHMSSQACMTLNSCHMKSSVLPCGNQPSINKTFMVPVKLYNNNNKFIQIRSNPTNPKIVCFNRRNNDIPKIVQLNQRNFNVQKFPINVKNGPQHQTRLKRPVIIPVNSGGPRNIVVSQSPSQYNNNLNHFVPKLFNFTQTTKLQVNNKLNSQILRASTNVDKTISHNAYPCVPSVKSNNGVTSSLSAKVGSTLVQNVKIINTSVTLSEKSSDLSTFPKIIYKINPNTLKKENKPCSDLNQVDGEDDDYDDALSEGIKSPKRYRIYDSILKFDVDGFSSEIIPKSAWTQIERKVAQMRNEQGLSKHPLKINIDEMCKFGLNHRWIIFLVEQMVGANECTQYEFKYRKRISLKVKEITSKSLEGCRVLPWAINQPRHKIRDPLAFLHYKSNRPPKNYALEELNTYEYPDPDNNYIQQLATQFHYLTSGAVARRKNVNVCVSNIHSRGLFARREFKPHDIIIEYLGETIRSILSDVREKLYQKDGVDCYMFRLDRDMIVDATYKGNAARFINHSCEPNCYAKVVIFEGEKHIIIIARRKIFKGEELTYDYRFPLEDEKLVCNCGSQCCRKFLN